MKFTLVGTGNGRMVLPSWQWEMEDGGEQEVTLLGSQAPAVIRLTYYNSMGVVIEVCGAEIREAQE
jgi:hypothetical protein